MTTTIDTYLCELLYDYPCVIVPGFGGFLSAYHPAEMELATHTIYPPSRMIAFNAALRSQDGLLVSHIAARTHCTYEHAAESVSEWAEKIQRLLRAGEEIYLPRIGRLYNDVERNIQFTPDRSVNYLRTSYGLPTIIAAPILRANHTIEHVERVRDSSPTIARHRRLGIAALLLLLLSIGSMSGLLYQGVTIQPLQLNTAGVFHIAEQLHPVVVVNPQPIIIPTTTLPDWQELPIADDIPFHPIEAKKETPPPTSVAPVPSTLPTTNTVAEIPARGKKAYYVMVGAFKEEKHLLRAMQGIQKRFPGEAIYKDTSPERIRIGFYAGATRAEAMAKLQSARHIDSTYWLLAR